MTSIREKLAGKQRRRLVVPIQITDPSEDQSAWMGAATALDVQRTKEEPAQELVDQLLKQMDAAEERVRSHFADVELRSMTQAEWEAANAGYTNDEGDIDWVEAVAPLLAASCVDDDLRDEAFWRDLMAQDHWTEGDTDSLRAALLRLNVYAVDARAPKD